MPIPHFSKSSIGTGLESAPSGYGSQYDSLFAANPYRNLTYQKSAWQNFLSWLGFRTDADRWKEDAQVNASEYDAGIYQMMQQNEYNEPSSQSERMRAAGLNPDLQGLGDVAGAASPPEDANGMSPNIGNEDFNSFGEGLMGVLSRTIATYKDFMSLGEMQNIIERGDSENAKLFLSTLDEIIGGALTTDDMKDKQSFTSAINTLYNFLGEDELNEWEDSIPYRYGFSKKRRKQFYDVARTRLNGLMTDKNAWERYKGLQDVGIAVNRGKSDPFYSASEQQDEAITILSSELSSLSRKVLSLQAKTVHYQSQVQNQYQHELLDQNAGIAQAQAEGSEYDARWYESQLKSQVALTKKRCIDLMEKAAERGNYFAKHFLINWSLDNLVGINSKPLEFMGNAEIMEGNFPGYSRTYTTSPY